ncbi:hypothetical protein DFJ74DRAFT_654330 [Hyaloraphidium curvatum]|nr:hypothetical protein DFJ74DRAFT_654330 [Hyaloraphidium curvatum]
MGPSYAELPGGASPSSPPSSAAPYASLGGGFDGFGRRPREGPPDPPPPLVEPTRPRDALSGRPEGTLPCDALSDPGPPEEDDPSLTIGGRSWLYGELPSDSPEPPVCLCGRPPWELRIPEVGLPEAGLRLGGPGGRSCVYEREESSESPPDADPSPDGRGGRFCEYANVESSELLTDPSSRSDVRAPAPSSPPFEWEPPRSALCGRV